MYIRQGNELMDLATDLLTNQKAEQPLDQPTT